MLKTAVIAASLLLIALADVRSAEAPPVIDPVSPGDLLIVGEMSLGPSNQPLRMPLRVQADGSILVPHVGPVAVSGLSLRAAEQAIDKAFTIAAILSQPHTCIDRLEMGARATIAIGPIAAGEALRVWIPDMGEASSGGLVWVLHVSGAGEVGLPYLGQFKVAGMSEAQADVAIQKAYEKAAILNQATVSVLRLAHDSDADRLPPMISSAGVRR